jgi:alanine dehydrogenase
MSSQVLAISQKDLIPLVEDPRSMDGAIEAVERATVDYYQGRVREQNLADQGPGTEVPNLLQIHFAADDGAVSGFQLFAEERGGPERPNSRFVAVLDKTTRELLALVDYWILSPVRVGASAGVGCRYLAPADPRTVAILGAGKQARGQLWAIRRAAPSLERARVFSPTPAHREAFAHQMSLWLGFPVEAVARAREAVEGADIVGLANNSREPVFEMPWVKPGALIATISGPAQLPPEAMDAPIVAPNPDAVLAREPYASRVKDGAATSDLVTALGAVILQEGNVRRAPEDIVVFEVSRLNIWAVAVADWAYRWAAERGVGTTFSLAGD